MDGVGKLPGQQLDRSPDDGRDSRSFRRPSLPAGGTPIVVPQSRRSRRRTTRLAVRRATLRDPNTALPPSHSILIARVRVRHGRRSRRACNYRSLRSRDQPDPDEVERADEAVTDAEPAGTRDRVPQRNRPVVLDEEQRGRRVVRDLGQHVPGVLVGEDGDAVRRRLGAGPAPASMPASPSKPRPISAPTLLPARPPRRR